MKVDIFNTNNKYKIIYADPAWSYKQAGGGAAKNHYRTTPTEEMMKLPIKQIKTDDAVCFMWATFPTILDAFKLMEAWGFHYKTAAFVWVKKNKNGSNFWGMGQYTRANAEVCLLGISDATRAQKTIIAHDVHQIIESVIGRHSEKPTEARDRIVKLMGDCPRIELFARQYAEGWDCWGDEV